MFTRAFRDIPREGIADPLPSFKDFFFYKSRRLQSNIFINIISNFRYFAGSALSSRFTQGYISPRRRVALIENGSLSHATPTYLATPSHYHPSSSQRTGTMEILDDFMDYVDPVVRPPPLPVLPPQILTAYHHGKFNSVT